MELVRSEVELKSADNGGFTGYASTFYTLDNHGDIVLPGAFQDGLVKFLDENFIGGAGHDWNNPLGKYTEAAEDRKGLLVVAKFSDTQAARDVRTLINDRVIRKLSVGMRLESVSHIKPPAVRKLWEDAGYRPTADDERALKRHQVVRLIHKAELMEVSPVTVPANDQARILSHKSDLPGDVSAYLTRIEQTARSIQSTALKLGRNDERVGLIYDAVCTLAGTIAAIGAKVSIEVKSEEVCGIAHMDADADAGAYTQSQPASLEDDAVLRLKLAMALTGCQR